MSSQWRPLETGGPHSGLSPLGSQLGGRPMGRPLTKNPQNLMANFHPASQQQSNGYGGFNNFPMSPTSGGNNPGNSMMSGSASTSRLSSLMSGSGGSNFDFGNGLDGGPSGDAGSRSSSSYGSGSGSHYSGSRSMYSESRSSNNGFNNSMMGQFDRSMSHYESGHNHHGGNSGGGFERQMSVPGNLSAGNKMHGMQNGFSNNRSGGYGGDRGGQSGGHGGMMSNESSFFGGGSSNNIFGGNGRSGSPQQMNGRSGFNDMKIGTWNSEMSSNSSNNGMGRGGGDSGHMNGQGGSGSGQGGFPSVGTFEIGTFNISTNNNTSGRSNGYNDPQHPPGPGHRETGIIEKLLHSYGFIQCCDRQARLFFHFSQFDGTIEHLKIGDPVEFEMTYDRRTGKPIASQVSKIAPEVVMREERVIGTVTTEARIDPETGTETQGRISYENRGECFFLPFTTNDVEGNVTVAAGDKVSFQMATMARSGNLVARTIRLENPASPVKYQGVVNSIQEDKTYGFIERADVVREIFFRDSDLQSGESVDLGDNVEFTIQTRDGKEVACNITKLPHGTVVFEDVGTEYFRGQVLKPLDRNYRGLTEGDALSGRVKYRAPDRSEKEVQFGETDQVGDFTLKHGDWIKFVIAVDRRDKHPRATKIELLDESFKVSDERREQGRVNTVKDAYGFIQCADRDAKIFFPLSECLDVTRHVKEGDDCEFTVADDPNQPGKLMATRIKILASGSVQFAIIVHNDIVGKVEIEPSSTLGWSKANKEGAGKILYELNGHNLEISLHANDCELRQFPHKGDIVRFDINQLKSTKETNAVNIRILESQHPQPQVPVTSSTSAASKTTPEAGEIHQGYIAALKDGFGFIETISHDREIFFHFSNVETKADRLEVGLEVEYTVFNREKGGKVSAENVRLLRRGTIPPIPGKEDVLHGKVVRPLRSVNPDQSDYCGLIQVKNEDGSIIIEYRFGIASLINKKELLQVGDAVQFHADLNENFAVNIHATREKLRSVVEAMKGQYGFLSYEVDEGKKLFFHTSEVEGNEALQEGDEVEFVVVTNKRTGKHSACCVRKLSSSKRPERLISKLKAMNLEDDARAGRKIVVIRQPKGPDGTKGFSAKRAY